MISMSRVLSFREYAAANKIALLHGTFGRRMNYLFYLWINPFLGTLALPIAIWKLVHAWNAPGDHGTSVGFWAGGAAFFLYLMFYPLLFRRKMKTLYKQQELHREWLIEVSDAGIHSTISGLSDSRLEWAYFNCFVETPEIFVMIKKLRPVFISLPKRVLTPAEQDELRSLLGAHLAKE
jgi:hypothetical protein